MLGETLRKLRIFVASPSDVMNERAKVASVVEMLKPLAESIGLALDVMNWDQVVPDAGRPEQIIIDQLKPTSWDLFIGILWHRFGTPTGKTNLETEEEFQSGTEEEFVTAYNLWRIHKRPRLMFYRCTRDVKLDALDPDQLKRVREFFKQVEDVKGNYPLLYQTFDTTETFEKLLSKNLQNILLVYNEQLRGKPLSLESVQVYAPRFPNNLPRRAVFFGRSREMDIVMRALNPTDHTWGVLVDGIGGIGKTAIALESAHRAQQEGIFDAFVYVTAKYNVLAPSGIREQMSIARTLEDFLRETSRLLGQPVGTKLSTKKKKSAILDMLRGTRTLLVYDNLETLSKEEQDAMADFLRELPQGCKAIITSRRRGGEGAIWLRVERLDWDSARRIIESEMSRDAGLAKKLDHVHSRWGELYEETNGSPLALVHLLGLMRVRTLLTFDSALGLLRGAGRSDDLVRFVYQEAHKELTENDKIALSALSFFNPSATFDAWMQVTGLSRAALESTIDRLDALSLVDIVADEESYILHPLTRAFVRDELLADTNFSQEMGLRFALYWAEYAERYGGVNAKNDKVYQRLHVDGANLDAAAKWLTDFAEWCDLNGKTADATRILARAAAIWQLLGSVDYWKKPPMVLDYLLK